MGWMDLYSESRAELGIEVRVKNDIYEIMTHAVKKVNADKEMKAIMQSFLTYAFDRYNSASGYKYAVLPPVQFVQWLSEQKGKTITIKDFEPPNLTEDDAHGFIRMNSRRGQAASASLRSSLNKFVKYLISRYKIVRNPFVDMKTDMPKSKRKIVFNSEQLDEFYNIILFGAKDIYLLYWNLLLQTGLRPSHAYILTCGDIDYNRPREDAMDRKFYPIYALSALSREKERKEEKVHKKNPPEIVYVSEDLANRIKQWCKDNDIPADGYIFETFFAYISFQVFVLDNRDSPEVKKRLKYKPNDYIIYALRDTWASTLYNISKNTVDLMNYGGWEGETTALKYYVNAFRATEAVDIARKWGIFIPPERKEEVAFIERMRAEAAEAKAPISKADMASLLALIDKLTAEVEELKKRGVQEEQFAYSY